MSTKGKESETVAVQDHEFQLDEFELEEQYSHAQVVEKHLQAMGLTSVQRPSATKDMARLLHVDEGTYFDGRLPPSLKNLTMEDLSDLHVLHASWIHYLTVLLNKVSLERSEVTPRKEAVWGMTRMFHKKTSKNLAGVNLTDQQCSDLARYDRRFVNVNSRYQQLTAHRDCLEALLKVAEQNCAVVSREVTRREATLYASRRSQNIELHHQEQPMRQAYRRGGVREQAQQKHPPTSKFDKSKKPGLKR